MTTRQDIKTWLKSPRGMSREDLAAAVGVKKRTVDNWLCGSLEIPLTKLQLVERIMEQRNAEVQQAPSNLTAVAMLMTEEMRKRISTAAQLAGLSFDEFIIAATNEKISRSGK